MEIRKVAASAKYQDRSPLVVARKSGHAVNRHTTIRRSIPESSGLRPGQNTPLLLRFDSEMMPIALRS